MANSDGRIINSNVLSTKVDIALQKNGLILQHKFDISLNDTKHGSG